MKVVILAGGYGTRLSEETLIKPKPMVEIGGYPILWHIMKIYYAYGLNEFIICLGYKGYIIKEYFANYLLHKADVTFDMAKNQTNIYNNQSEDWKITLIDTGEDSLTGGRLKRVEKYIGDEDFCFTYGDGVSDVKINDLIEFHQKQGVLATLTAVKPPARYGSVEIKNDKVSNFREKPDWASGWINGGFFVLNPKVLELIENDYTTWEKEPLESLSKMSQLSAFKHHGFWHSMDTLRDKNRLEDYWKSGKAPWKVW